MTPRTATVIVAIAAIMAAPLAAQVDGPPTRWRGYALAAAGALVMGSVASLTDDPDETAQAGFCSSRSCVMGVSTVLGAGLGFLVGNEFDSRAARRYEEGPSFGLTVTAAALDDQPVALVTSSRGLVALTRSGAGFVGRDLTYRSVPVPGVPRSGTVLEESGVVLVGTSDQIWSFASASSEPHLVWESGASALASVGGSSVVVGEVGRIRLASFQGGGGAGGTLLEERTMATRGLPVALVTGRGTQALWTLVDTFLVARDPVTLMEQGRLGLDARGLHVSVSGRTGVVSLGPGGARLVDLTDATRPREMSVLGGMDFAYAGAVLDGRAYVAAGPQGLFVFDVTSPTAPVSLGVARDMGFASGVAVHDGRVHVLDRERNQLVRVEGSGR